MTITKFEEVEVNQLRVGPDYEMILQLNESLRAIIESFENIDYGDLNPGDGVPYTQPEKDKLETVEEHAAAEGDILTWIGL